MPRGTKHRITGLLLNARRGLIVEVDDGGEWSLDASLGAHKFVGQRVIVEGVRFGFDLLNVERIKLE